MSRLYPPPPSRITLRDLRDTIERLTAELATLTAERDALRVEKDDMLAVMRHASREHIGLKAENERLLEALRFYAATCDANESGECDHDGALCCRVARAAIDAALRTGEGWPDCYDHDGNPVWYKHTPCPPSRRREIKSRTGEGET